MTKTKESFWIWVESEMARRHLSYYRIEKRAGLANAAVSKQARNRAVPSFTACQVIASAFDFSLVGVLAKAGYVPEPECEFGEVEQVAEILRSLPAGSIRDDALAAVRAVAEDARRRASGNSEKE